MDRKITVLIGIMTIVFGFIADVFYPGLHGTKKKALPKWVGRIWFLGIGAWLIFLGLHR
jgi:hypothetical protein